MKRIIVFLMVMRFGLVNAQEDLLTELESSEDDMAFAIATFKGSRIVNGQSVETRKKGELEFIFSHRFGSVKEGAYGLWGLDQSVTRLGLEYGINDRLSVAVGRTSTDRTFDGYVKYKVLRQSDRIPLSVTAAGSVFYRTSPRNRDLAEPLRAVDRLAYASQLFIARKITSRMSAQLNPLWVYRNRVNQALENHSDWALGIAGRYKITPSFSMSAEYLVRLNPPANQPPLYSRYDAIGLGFEIETGGHVFQIVLTNTLGMFERYTVAETYENFWDGDLHLGFNITRSFQLSRKR